MTGVNARRIVDWKIGPSVTIRKGGDVIPLIESVKLELRYRIPLKGRGNGRALLRLR